MQNSPLRFVLYAVRPTVVGDRSISQFDTPNLKTRNRLRGVDSPTVHVWKEWSLSNLFSYHLTMDGGPMTKTT